MTYLRALLISLLVHSLAFAGSYMLLNNFFAAHRTSSIQRQFMTVDVINVASEVKPSTVREALPANQTRAKKAKVSKVLKAIETAVVATSSSTQSQRLATQTAFAQNGDEDGGANLVPHPNNQSPQYPESARKEGLTGSMVLELTVNARGLIDRVEIKEGKDTPEILQQTAIDAIKTWRFLYKASPKSPIKIQVPVVFSLD